MYFRSTGTRLSLKAWLVVILGLVTLAYVSALPLSGSEGSSGPISTLVPRMDYKLKARIIYEEHNGKSSEGSQSITEAISKKITSQVDIPVKITVGTNAVPRLQHGKLEFNIEWLDMRNRALTTKGHVTDLHSDSVRKTGLGLDVGGTQTKSDQYSVTIDDPEIFAVMWDKPSTEMSSRIAATAQTKIQRALMKDLNVELLVIFAHGDFGTVESDGSTIRFSARQMIPGSQAFKGHLQLSNGQFEAYFEDIPSHTALVPGIKITPPTPELS